MAENNNIQGEGLQTTVSNMVQQGLISQEMGQNMVNAQQQVNVAPTPQPKVLEITGTVTGMDNLKNQKSGKGNQYRSMKLLVSTDDGDKKFWYNQFPNKTTGQYEDIPIGKNVSIKYTETPKTFTNGEGKAVHYVQNNIHGFDGLTVITGDIAQATKTTTQTIPNTQTTSVQLSPSLPPIGKIQEFKELYINACKGKNQETSATHFIGAFMVNMMKDDELTRLLMKVFEE